jgi:hypothetical protein
MPAAVRILLIAAVLAVATPALADDVKPEQWVGTWSGKATSKGCSDTIAKKLALDVAVTSSGGLRSNGDAIIEGLGDLDWKTSGKGLVLDREGLTGSLKPAKGAARLVLTTAAGCVVKATLKRPTSGIASCDRVRALATVKAQCGSGDRLAEVEASWSAWKKLTGKKKKAQAKACTEEAATLETEASCGSTVRASSGIAECDAYVALMDRWLRCDKVPQAARDGAKQGIDAMLAGWDTVKDWSEEQRKVAADACGQAVDALRQGAQAMGCPL